MTILGRMFSDLFQNGLFVLGIPLVKWFTTIGIFFTVSLGLTLIRKVLGQKLAALAKRTTSDIDDFFVGLIEKTKSWFIFIVSICSAAFYLNASPSIDKGFRSFLVVGVLVQAAFWGEDTIRFFLFRILKQREAKHGPDLALETTIAAFQFLCRTALYILILLLILDNLGFNVTTLIAGLGVGGIAIALAAQNILGDLFASLSIVLDKPFVMGDYIEVGAQKGRVEKIGLKTTRIRSVSGEQIIMSNTDLLGSRILNFERLLEKRMVLNLGVNYQTPTAQIKKIPELLKNIISQQSQTRFVSSAFKGFGESSLNFEAVYFVTSKKWEDHLSKEEAVNFEVLEVFNREKIGFAYPTRTLIMEKPL